MLPDSFRGLFEQRLRRHVLAGQQAAGVGIARQDGYAIGRGYRSGAAAAGEPFEQR
jgi:hypothetical protein